MFITRCHFDGRVSRAYSIPQFKAALHQQMQGFLRGWVAGLFFFRGAVVLFRSAVLGQPGVSAPGCSFLI
jgi:hypothetical protein